MVLPWFSAETKERAGVAAVGFVLRVAAATMRCFLGCFLGRDSHSRLASTPSEPTVSYDNNSLSSLFISDRDSLRKRREGLNSLTEELEVKELENEAKFLKACGTLLDTPVEIRKASGKLVDTSTQNEEAESSTLKLWISGSSSEKQSDDSPTHVGTCQEWVAGSGSPVRTPSSCTTDDHNTGGDSIKSIQSGDIQNVFTLTDVSEKETCFSKSSVSPEAFATNAQGKSKSVRFECKSEKFTDSPESPKQSGTEGNHSSKASPNPTPLRLTDEMQTPGTVFPVCMDNMAGRKLGRIRSQYVYSIFNPVDCPFQEKELKDENSDPNTKEESPKPSSELALASTPIPSLLAENLLLGKSRNDDASLSPWLKPHSANHDLANEQYDPTVGGHIHHGTTPGDRPILGMVAAHWNDNEISHISPKGWDGNGIPNTTNKYKEDKKVKWHVTPFEERLEKALSEETSISQRKPIGGIPVAELNETEESDTAASSQVYSAAHRKSVVSF